jgi:hypothetical protein
MPRGGASGEKQISPFLQSEFCMQLRLPGRVVPSGSRGAPGGGLRTRASEYEDDDEDDEFEGDELDEYDPIGGEIGPPQATSASRTTKRMTRTYRHLAPRVMRRAWAAMSRAAQRVASATHARHTPAAREALDWHLSRLTKSRIDNQPRSL